MTDRYFAVTVLLKNDTREDDLEYILNAIRMIKGVQKVEPHIATPETWAAEQRVRRELEQKLREVISPPS